MPFAQSTDGQPIHFEVLGKEGAPPLLLIMGLGLSGRAWDRLPERFAADHRVITFDNRGTGKSAPIRWGTRMDQLADDAAAVLRASGAALSGPASVFGISMGGVIAQELCLRHPQLVGSLALGATLSDWMGGFWPSLSALRDLILLNAAHAAQTAERAGALLVSAEWERCKPGDAQAWLSRDPGQATTLRPVLAQLTALLRSSTCDRLHLLRAPTLILAGTADRVVPVENSRRLAWQIPDARLVELHGAGHAFPLEREEETVAALREHFARPRTRSVRSRFARVFGQAQKPAEPLLAAG